MGKSVPDDGHFKVDCKRAAGNYFFTCGDYTEALKKKYKQIEKENIGVAS